MLLLLLLLLLLLPTKWERFQTNNDNIEESVSEAERFPEAHEARNMDSQR